jgi:L-arabinokinase
MVPVTDELLSPTECDVVTDSPADLDDWVASKRSHPLVIYYITAHGWGHLTRALAVAFELLRQRITVLFCTTIPQSKVYAHLAQLAEAYDRQLLGDCSWTILSQALRVRSVQLDVGCIQKDALTIDATATLNAYAKLNEHRRVLVRKEAVFLRHMEPQLLVSDAVALAAVAADEAGLSSRFLFLTNFFFSAIYAGFLKAHPGLDVPKYRVLLQQMVADEAHAAAWVQLTPGMLSPVEPFPGEKLPAPPISRPWKCSPQEMRMRLRVGADCKILLVCFGSFDCRSLFGDHSVLLRSFFERVDLVDTSDSPWKILVPVDGIPEGSSARVRFIHAADRWYMPDLIQTADVVLGKLGYGICAECLAAHTPLVYVRRAMFAEEDALCNDMKQLGAELSTEAFRSGRWKQAVHQALEMKSADRLPASRRENPLVGLQHIFRLLCERMQA